MSYHIIIENKAKKEIKRLHPVLGKQVIKKIFDLAENPRPHGYIKMTNYESERIENHEFYRIRVGDSRIIYTIEEDIITITIVKVRHRKEVYK